MRACVFAHYDRDGRVDDYVLRYLRGLRGVCGRLVVVSTASLDAEGVGLLEALADRVMVRENLGYDFLSWRIGLEELALEQCDEVVLCNDSCYGPFSPFEAVFSSMLPVDCDFWGLTQNSELAFHLQSYFLVFRRPVLAGDAFARFWAGVHPQEMKQDVILKYEVGLTQQLLAAGFKSAAFFRPGREDRGNPTLLDWAALLHAGVPLLKIELIRDNPRRADLSGLPGVLTAKAPGSLREIHSHLARTRMEGSRSGAARLGVFNGTRRLAGYARRGLARVFARMASFFG